MQKEILKTSKVRISQRMGERQLELMSITDMLVTVNGIVEDIQKECDVAEATNKENERNFNLAVEDVRYGYLLAVEYFSFIGRGNPKLAESLCH